MKPKNGLASGGIGQFSNLGATLKAARRFRGILDNVRKALENKDKLPQAIQAEISQTLTAEMDKIEPITISFKNLSLYAYISKSEPKSTFPSLLTSRSNP